MKDENEADGDLSLAGGRMRHAGKLAKLHPLTKEALPKPVSGFCVSSSHNPLLPQASLEKNKNDTTADVRLRE